VDAGAEADGGDEAQQERPLGRVLADVAGEEGDDEAGDGEFHEDEQPADADDLRGRERRGGVEDDARQRRPLTEAEHVDADGGRQRVEGVPEECEQAERPRGGRLGGESRHDPPRQRGDDDRGDEGEAGPDDRERPGGEAGEEREAGEAGGDEQPRSRERLRRGEVGRVEREPRRAGDDGHGEVDGGRAGERFDRGRERADDVENVQRRPRHHPRDEREDVRGRDRRSRATQSDADADESRDEGDEVGERREREPLGENGHAGGAAGRRESLTFFSLGSPPPGMNRADLAARIDHTVLGPETTMADVEAVLDDAAEWGMNACIPPCYVAEASEYAPDVLLATVVGFPHGQHTTTAKREEAVDAWQAGADELDMVINVGRLKAGDDELVTEDISEVVAAVPVPVKVIIETALLTEEEKHRACEAAAEADAAFVKTATGFADGGATVEDVELMAEYLPVKASGGVGSYDEAVAMFEAGAERIGASSGVDIVSGAPGE